MVAELKSRTVCLGFEVRERVGCLHPDTLGDHVPHPVYNYKGCVGT